MISVRMKAPQSGSANWSTTFSACSVVKRGSQTDRYREGPVRLFDAQNTPVPSSGVERDAGEMSSAVDAEFAVGGGEVYFERVWTRGRYALGPSTAGPKFGSPAFDEWCSAADVRELDAAAQMLVRLAVPARASQRSAHVDEGLAYSRRAGEPMRTVVASRRSPGSWPPWIRPATRTDLPRRLVTAPAGPQAGTPCRPGGRRRSGRSCRRVPAPAASPVPRWTPR